MGEQWMVFLMFAIKSDFMNRDLETGTYFFIRSCTGLELLRSVEGRGIKEFDYQLL